jgi:hypothetical protein
MTEARATTNETRVELVPAEAACRDRDTQSGEVTGEIAGNEHLSPLAGKKTMGANQTVVGLGLTSTSLKSTQGSKRRTHVPPEH